MRYVGQNIIHFIRLCLGNGLDEERLKEHGYTSFLNYTMGYKYGFSSIGWGGRFQDKKEDPGMTVFIAIEKNI